MARLPIALLVAVLVAAGALPAAAQARPAPRPRTTTHRIASGTTTLTLSPQSQANLASMGITMSAIPPASGTSATGVLTFPVAHGRVRTRGTTLVRGHIVAAGILQLAKGAVVVPLTNPTVILGPHPVFTGMLGTLSLLVGTLDMSSATVHVTNTRLSITGTALHLSAIAANSLNATFGVTGFHPDDLIGTGNLTATFR
jgi:hypothetical protein